MIAQLVHDVGYDIDRSLDGVDGCDCCNGSPLERFMLNVVDVDSYGEVASPWQYGAYNTPERVTVLSRGVNLE